MKANFIVMIMILIIVAFFIGCVSNEKNGTSTATFNSAVNASLQPDTVFKGQGYTISIPSSWKTRQEVSKSNWINEIMDFGDGKSLLMISRQPNPNPESTTETAVADMKQKYKNKGITIDVEEQTTVGGLPATRLIFKDGSSGTKYMQILTTKDNHALIIQYSSWPDLFDQKVSKINDIINTLKFE